jgi:hypothetical protein
MSPAICSRNCKPITEGELLFSGVEHDSGPEAVAEPVRKVAQAAEVLATDALGGLDLDTDHGTGRMLQHHVHLHLVTVTVVKELHRLFGPGELTRDLADREVLQQRPDGSHWIFGALL